MKTISIVPNSGTDELKGITGNSNIESGPAKEFPIIYYYEILAWHTFFFVPGISTGTIR